MSSDAGIADMPSAVLESLRRGFRYLQGIQGADGGEVRNGDGVRACARPGADQNIHPEIFQGGVEDFLNVWQEAMNLVDEENLSLPDVGEDAGEVELFLENGAGGLFEINAQFAGDDVR